MFELSYIEDLLAQYGYWLILGWTFIEGETVVILAGILAGAKGILRPEIIALCAFIGSFCSDQLMFFLGRKFGPAIFERFPKLKKNTHKALELIAKYENALMVGFRFVYGVRNITPIMFGMGGVSHLKFFFLNAIGGVIWALSFAYGGYYLGMAFMEYSHIVGYSLVGIIVIAVAIWWIRRKRRKTIVEHAEVVSLDHCSWDHSAEGKCQVQEKVNASMDDKGND